MHPKRLVVMRHAKSDWDSDAKSDHERPLNRRGQREAPLVGALLRDKGFVPDLCLSSDSVRTRETWERMRDDLGHVAVLYDRTLYLGGLEAVREAVEREADRLDGVSTLMLLGHNPGWEEMIRALTGHRLDLKTAHAAILEARDARSTFGACLASEQGFSLLEVVRPPD